MFTGRNFHVAMGGTNVIYVTKAGHNGRILKVGWKGE